MSFRPIFGKPRLIHDWGEEQHERETHWTSLFYDLIIVAALNAIAEPFEELEEGSSEGGTEEGGEGEGGGAPMLSPIKALWLNALLQFASVVMPWNELNEFTSRFEDDSFVGHLAFFVHCFGLASTTAGCVGPLRDNYPTLAVGVIMTKVGLLVLHVRPMYYIPRARLQCLVRCSSFAVVIGLMLFGLTLSGPDAYERFRVVLIVATIWSLLSLPLLLVLKQHHRLPLHIQSYSDRIKEVTMVIFGEAIFAVTLLPKSMAVKDSHFYAALATTLWLIYSLALQEYHIAPSVDDHALRRSILFGFLWFYTQFFKQTCLLAASIGIKRAHFLTFIAPDEPIDNDTHHLLVWGMSLTLLAVVLIRSYSMGFGRHPNRHDPPPLWRLKAALWTALTLSCWMPQWIGITVMKTHPEPLFCLVALGLMMFAIILFETYASNKTAELIAEKLKTDTGTVGEMTYLGSTAAHLAHMKPHEECFLQIQAPKAEKEADRLHQDQAS